MFEYCKLTEHKIMSVEVPKLSDLRVMTLNSIFLEIILDITQYATIGNRLNLYLSPILTILMQQDQDAFPGVADMS